MKTDTKSLQPGRTRKSSFAAAVADLEVGEQVAKLKRIDTDQTIDQIHASMQSEKDALRNNTTPAVTRAKAETGGQYTIEVTDFQTGSRNWFLIAVVTRTA